MSKISPFNNWLLESADPEKLKRLLKLGLAEDRSPVEWIEYLIETEPDWYCSPVLSPMARSIRLINELNGDTFFIEIEFSWAGAEYAGENGEPISVRVSAKIGTRPTSQRADEIPRGLGNFEVAEWILKTIWDRYYPNTLSESSSNIARLVDLGIVPDRPVAEWVDELTQTEPNLSLANMSTGNTFTVQHGRDKAVVLVRQDYVEIQYSEAGGARSWSQRYGEYQGMLEPGDTNLTIAQKVIDKIKGYYKPVLPESLDRLAQLGMVPDKPFNEWILDAIDGDPTFSLHANYRDQTVYLNHVPTGTLVGVHLNKRRGGAPKELSIIYTDPSFYEPGPERSRPKQWLKKLDPATGQYEIAQLALQHIKARFSAVPESLDPPGTPSQTPLSEAVDIEKIKRLIALGVIPEPKNSWSLVDALVKKEYPDYSIDSDSTRISLYGGDGWSIDLYRTSVLSYEFNYSAPDGTDTGRRWQLPRSIAAGQTHKHKYEIAEVVFDEIKKFIESVLK